MLLLLLAVVAGAIPISIVGGVVDGTQVWWAPYLAAVGEFAIVFFLGRLSGRAAQSIGIGLGVGSAIATVVALANGELASAPGFALMGAIGAFFAAAVAAAVGP